MRSAAAVIVVVLIGAVVLLVVGGSRSTPQIDTLGVYPQDPAVELSAGALACEYPLQLQPDVVRVGFNTSAAKPPARLDVTVEPEGGGKPYVRSPVSIAPADGRATASLRGAPRDRLVRVCVRHVGGRPVTIWGVVPRPRTDETVAGLLAGRYATSNVQLEVNGRKQESDLALEFLADSPRSLTSLMAAAPERAATFLPSPLGGWTVWLLLVMAVVGGTVALAWAVRDAERGA